MNVNIHLQCHKIFTFIRNYITIANQLLVAPIPIMAFICIYLYIKYISCVIYN